MPIITSIKPQKKKGRYNIHLDGKFAFALDEMTLAKGKLKVGLNLGEEAVFKLQNEGELNKLFDKVLWFLSYRSRSEREVKNYLCRKTSNKELVGEVIKRLRDKNYIDDQAFAAWWVQQRKRQQKGIRLIKSELFQKGLGKEVIEAVLEECGGDDYEAAFDAARRRVKRCKNVGTEKAKQKITSFLARRGFTWETINQVIREIF